MEEQETETVVPKDSFLKMFWQNFYQRPAALLCAICLWFSYNLYTDNKDFIRQQQDCLKQITASISEVQKCLVELNVRVQNIEHNHGKLQTMNQIPNGDKFYIYENENERITNYKGNPN